MTLRIAVKRLSAVEIDPRRSHQHEFHAGHLRRELEFGDDKVSGPMSVLIFEADDRPAVVDEATFTLYDARADNPSRAAEWHLYYTSSLLAERSRAGDLLILYRDRTTLLAIIARHGTQIERDLVKASRLGEAAIREQFLFLDVPTPSEAEARVIASELTFDEGRGRDDDVADDALFERATRDRRMPTSNEMASAAEQIVAVKGLKPLDPDEYLSAVLLAETTLYYRIESEIHEARKLEMLAMKPSLADLIDFAATIQQSRRSRRGLSLQNHFASLLIALQIPYSAQCSTEDGETPDFVVPGCREYHDSAFPADRLRMVACKSTARERWRQVLNEAARIPEKYLLTLDPGLTDATIQAMRRARLIPFLPRATGSDFYAARPKATQPGSVGDLVARLRSVV